MKTRKRVLLIVALVVVTAFISAVATYAIANNQSEPEAYVCNCHQVPYTEYKTVCTELCFWQVSLEWRSPLGVLNEPLCDCEQIPTTSWYEECDICYR